MGIQSRLPKSFASEDLEKLPLTSPEAENIKDHPVPSKSAVSLSLSAPALFLILLYLITPTTYYPFEFPFPSKPSPPLPSHVIEGIAKCEILNRPVPDFKPHDGRRKYSDRFLEGTGAVWLKNGTVWTGEEEGNEVRYGAGVWMEGGVIRKIGGDEELGGLKEMSKGKVEEVELNGAWVTPGIVDLHSHLGVDPAPGLSGLESTNSLKAAVQPWLRSLDGINIHDAAFNLSIAGGITTMLVLPGSAGNIGGQAFPVKPRWTNENTPSSMLVEPAWIIRNGSLERAAGHRHLKMATGENQMRVYGSTRMDQGYDFRRAYTEGKKLKDQQDRWCADPKTQKEPLPESLEWEALADAIRGNVKVNSHTYQETDINMLASLSNEFKVKWAAVHHAHQAYTVTDLLHSFYGGAPAAAIFATNARYKAESYFGSEFAPKILADAGISVVMKSDHPVLDSRYLVYEAAQAHHYGLNFSQALGSVTTHSAKAMGMDHRLGYVRPGYDADVVVWDSFPLALGATPKQTYIDGIPQIIKPVVADKPASAQAISEAGKFDREAAEALATRGDPDLRPKKSIKNVIFQDVGNFYLPGHGLSMTSLGEETGRDVVVSEGVISCVGKCVVAEGLEFEVIDLKGGSIAPGLITVGSHLGNREIGPEKSTGEGVGYDALEEVSELIDGLLVHGVDGAQFGGKDTLLAYKDGVTTGVTVPTSSSFFTGLSYAFSTSAENSLSPHAILNPSAALFLSLDKSKVSISTKIAVLRRLLSGELNGEEHSEIVQVVKDVKHGLRRLVVTANKADSIAALVRLKRDVAPGMKLTILGGTESWMIAEDLAKEDIGVIVSPARSYPSDWDHRRIIPGPPLSKHTLPSFLASAGVKVGLGITEEWQARNTRLDSAWVYVNSPDVFSKTEAIDLVSKNLVELLGLEGLDEVMGGFETGWVAYEGDMFGLDARVRGVRGAGVEGVDLF